MFDSVLNTPLTAQKMKFSIRVSSVMKWNWKPSLFVQCLHQNIHLAKYLRNKYSNCSIYSSLWSAYDNIHATAYDNIQIKCPDIPVYTQSLTQLKAVNCFRKILHSRCLTGFWMYLLHGPYSLCKREIADQIKTCSFVCFLQW